MTQLDSTVRRMTKNDNTPGVESTGPAHVPLTALTLTAPLRPVNAEHVALLIDVLDQCSPLLVHRDTGRVLDGHHRAAAATARGDHSVAVQWVDGDEAELLEVALRANTAHGLPLTRAERRQGVDKLIELRPAWSNRRIAEAAGVSDATVRRRRKAPPHGTAGRPASSMTHLDSPREGRDGKQYPTQRIDLADLVRTHPSASDRQIARLARCSPTTVATWRRRQALECTDRSTSEARRARGPLRAVRRILAWVLTLLRRGPHGGV